MYPYEVLFVRLSLSLSLYLYLSLYMYMYVYMYIYIYIYKPKCYDFTDILVSSKPLLTMVLLIAIITNSDAQEHLIAIITNNVVVAPVSSSGF